SMPCPCPTPPRSPPCFFFLMPTPPPTSTLFPYTTLFRSAQAELLVRVSDPLARAPRGDRDDRARRALGVGRDHVGRVLAPDPERSEEHTSELQSLTNLVCRLLLEKKKTHMVHALSGLETH